MRTENIGIFIRNKTNSTTSVIKISLLSEEIWLTNFKIIVLRDATQLKAWCFYKDNESEQHGGLEVRINLKFHKDIIINDQFNIKKNNNKEKYKWINDNQYLRCMVIVDLIITTLRYLLDINVISELGGNSFGIDYTLNSFDGI